jgi:hypothetical protein
VDLIARCGARRPIGRQRQELENAIEHAVIVESGPVIHPASLPAAIAADAADIPARRVV